MVAKAKAGLTTSAASGKLQGKAKATKKAPEQSPKAALKRTVPLAAVPAPAAKKKQVPAAERGFSEGKIRECQEVLEKLARAFRKSLSEEVAQFSKEFHALFPHQIGSRRPAPISSFEVLEEKQELLKFCLRMGFETVDSNTGTASLSPEDLGADAEAPDSLDTAVKGLVAQKAVTESNNRSRSLAVMQAGKPTKRMDPKLYAAVMLYTSNTVHTDLNRCLRSLDKAKISKYAKYLRLLFEAMFYLPKQKRLLWRAVAVDLEGDPNYEPGRSVTWWGVTSCTADKKVADGFAAACGSGCTVFTIVNCSKARDISAISSCSNEREFVLLPGTKFQVTSRAKKGPVTEITLSEVADKAQVVEAYCNSCFQRRASRNTADVD